MVTTKPEPPSPAVVTTPTSIIEIIKQDPVPVPKPKLDNGKKETADDKKAAKKAAVAKMQAAVAK